MPSVTAISLQMKLLLFVLLLGTRKPIPRNIGYSLKRLMVSVEVLDIGTTKLMLFLFLLVSPLLWKTPAFTPDLSVTQRTPPAVLPRIRSHWAFTLTTLSTSLKIPLLNLFSTNCLVNAARLILWVLLNGSLASTSLGASHLLPLPSISTNRVLRLI